MFDDLALGFSVALTTTNLSFAFLGCLLGTLVGVLPGIGAVSAVAILLPATFYLEPTTAIIMLSGIYYGAQYGGSITAILVNIPGEGSAIVTCIDGYQMARQGRAGAALAIAALGSFFGGTVATVLIAVVATPLSYVGRAFGSPEYFSLMLFGLIGATVLARGSVINAIAMTILGLLIGTVGNDIYTSVPRFTFGADELLFDGLSFVAVAVGLFGLTEIIINLSGSSSEARSIVTQKITRLWPTYAEFRTAFPAILRGTVIGSALGVMPGAGAVLSSFASYAVEKKLARDPSRFGKGAIEGVAGPETANNAGAQTNFIPMLTLGIPSSPLMALMVTCLLIQGIVPGPRMIASEPEAFWGLIASMWIGNVMLLIINLPMIGIWVSLLRVPYRILFPAILLVCAIGVYGINYRTFDIAVAAFLGLLGCFFRRVNCEPAPLILGMVLGQLVEDHFRRSLIISRGDPSIFVTQPLSLAFLILSALLVVVLVSPFLRRRREVVFAADEP